MSENTNENKMESKLKKSSQSADSNLVDITKLIDSKTNVRWKKEAFMQFANFKKGKVVTVSEFEALWNKFSKAYLGGKS
ncbi:MAG: hypothetical protein JXB50_02220 [Spirochaetes bacterium]|nr:hypothetical protein [Spirochaetota bacterium]